MFSPTEEEIEFAKKVIAEFDRAEAKGSAAIELEGKLIDYAQVHRARRVLIISNLLIKAKSI